MLSNVAKLYYKKKLGLVDPQPVIEAVLEVDIPTIPEPVTKQAVEVPTVPEPQPETK
jgi:hypothetical protein